MLTTQVFSQDMQNTVNHNNKFSFELYKAIKAKPINIIFSPFSISSALAMTYTGAKNNTLEEMSKTLHFNKNFNIHNSNFSTLQKNIISGNKDVKINIANSLWAQENYHFLENFITINKKYYKAGIQFTNFNGNIEHSRKKINNWVEKETNDKIKNLIKKNTLDNSTRLVLVNAIYFNGAWKHPFNKENNTEDIFYIFSKCQTKATYMNKLVTGKYYENKLLHIVEIPYKNNIASLMIILPKERFGIMDVEKILNEDKLNEYSDKLTYKKVQLSLPKFKFTSEYELSEQLSKMGMPSAFGKEADFSGMTGNKDLYIDKIIHKAFIEVNEKGTEAAAATAVTMRKTSAMFEKVNLKIDHPFIFLIKDNKTGSILFSGRVLDPNL
ncbi:MAG: serpin family protein [Bacteroidales bacterium]|jgi:serpin B|nr:serpin family protein [Bacteroidales bacterium]